MAVSGSGTSADPYIVSSWDEYLTVRPSSVETETFIKFDNKNIENGEFTGSGSGTRNDPYICNTFEEICITLGCKKIWQADIYDDCEETDKMKVYYNSKTDKYAKHIRTPTTIDLEEYLDRDDVTTLDIGGVVDFNGWTLTNIRCINTTNFLNLYKINGVIITNFVCEYDNNSYRVISDNISYIYDSTIQFHISAPKDSQYVYNIYIFPYMYYGLRVKRTSFDISGICTVFYFAEASSNAQSRELKMYDSIVNFDLSVRYISENNAGSYYNTKFTGEIDAMETYSGRDAHTIGYNFTDCIIDANIHTSDNNKCMTKSSSNANNLYNSDKISMSSGTNGFTGISTESLESAEDIAATGFPIGVD